MRILLTRVPRRRRSLAAGRVARGTRVSCGHRMRLGKGDPHGRPASWGRFEVDAAAEGGHDFADDREPEPEVARAPAFGAVEAVEDSVLALQGNPRAGIAHLERDAAVAEWPRRNDDLSFRRVLDGVRSQVRDRLLDEVWLGHDQEPGGALDLHP